MSVDLKITPDLDRIKNRKSEWLHHVDRLLNILKDYKPRGEKKDDDENL